MALLKSKPSTMPEDAIVLSEKEALKYQINIVKKWPNISDVFALRYGPYILGGAAVLNGAFFNNHFRRKFMLGNYGTISSYLPICVVPGILTALMHTELVLRHIILLKSDHCPICLETRAAALQASISVVCPLVIAPVGCAALASRYSTYDLPYLHEKPKEVFKIFKGMFRKIKNTTFNLFLGQAFLGAVITYFESSNLFTISKKLAQEQEVIR